MLKGKKLLVGEASSPIAIRDLEITPKVEPVIKMSQKNSSTLPPLYNDIDRSMIAKVPMPIWLELCNKIHHDDFPKFTLHSDP
jgi:hypothetical protein